MAALRRRGSSILVVPLACQDHSDPRPSLTKRPLHSRSRPLHRSIPRQSRERTSLSQPSMEHSTQSRRVRIDAIHITLVHGTNATDGSWFREDSWFRKQLQILLPMPIEYHYVLWDGHNSHESRLAGAKRLSEHVAEIRRLASPTHHYLICHSHGGNIALYAAKDRSFVEALSGLVTLGTPFICCAPNRAVSVFSKKSNYIETIILAVFCIVMLPLVVLAMLSKPFFLWHVVGEWDDFVWITPLLFGFTYLFVRVLLKAKRWSQGFADYLDSVQTTSAELLTPAPFPGERLMVVRVSTDEAGWWLRLISALGQMPHKFNRFLDMMVIATYFPRTGWGLTLATFGFALADPIRLREQGWSIESAAASLILGGFFSFGLSLAAEVVGLAATTLTVVAVLILPFFSVAVRSHRLGFGVERFLQAAIVDMHTVSIPLTEGPPPRVVNVSSGRFFGLFGGLRHSVFYESPQVVSAIAGWLTERELGREQIVVDPSIERMPNVE